MWSLLKFLLDLVVCVVWYGGKALLFVVCAICWGAYFTVMLPFWLLGWAEWPYLRE